MASFWKLRSLAAPLLLVVLLAACGTSQARSPVALRTSRTIFNATGEHCYCEVCRRGTFGHNYCTICDADQQHHEPYQPSRSVPCRCDVPHCLKCRDGKCVMCSVGYSIRSHAQGVCVRNYYHYHYTSSSSSDYSESKIDYSDTYSVGLLPLVLVTAIVVMALRRMRLRRRLEAHEISVNGVLSGPMPMPTAVAHDGNDGAERGGGAETSPLLTQSQRATKSNSVLVVGPSGSLGVGVAVKDDVSPLAPEGV